MRASVVVTAAIIERDDAFLITRRQKGVHLEGLWEFPGGKCEPGEDRAACLARELREELAVTARVGEEIFTITHTYSDRVVELHFLRCELTGTPVPQIGQEMRWTRRSDLAGLEFPPADAELIRLLTKQR
jgi:8-oxo-dGTP diphosphatase